MMVKPKLSLVAEYDRIVHDRAVLTAGTETDFLKFVLGQEVFWKQFVETTKCNEELKKELKDSKQKSLLLETQLKHARNQIDHEIQKRQLLENEKDMLEHQISLVREVLNDKGNQSVILNEKDREKLAFLNSGFRLSSEDYSAKRNLPTIDESTSLLSPNDISYDKTEEDINVSIPRDGRKWKPSVPGAESSSKKACRKHRRSNSTEMVTMEVEVPAGHSTTELGIISERQRRFSSPVPLEGDSDAANTAFNIGRRDGLSVWSTVSNLGTAWLTRNTSASALNRPHYFISKTCIKSETCVACGKKLRFGKTVLKCKDCHANSHVECKELLPMPCVPTVSSPKTLKSDVGLISYYASSDPPMIPAIVIYCVNEIEARGFNEGIYRVSGSEKDVKELKEKFLRGKVIPNLSLVGDIHVISGCLKDFLRTLKEPLITYRLWHEFALAAGKSDKHDSLSETYQAVSKLPQPNRDTLSYLMLHLKKIAENSECRMPAENLSIVFGPTLIGYSTVEPALASVLSETRLQQKIMMQLMSISSDYWATFINANSASNKIQNCQTIYTPEVGLPHSILGPITLSGEHEDQDKFRCLTPKFGKKVLPTQNKIFASPI